MENKDRPWVGVDAIIQSDDGKILLIQRSQNSKNYPGYWALLSGWIECGETAVAALKREAKEELGIEIEVIKFTGKYYDALGRHPTKTCLCVPHICKIASGEPKPNQPEGVQGVKWFSPGKIRKMDLAYDHKQMLQDAGLI